MFDVEKRLVFDIYVCPNYRHTEFFYKTAQGALDWGLIKQVTRQPISIIP